MDDKTSVMATSNRLETGLSKTAKWIVLLIICIPLSLGLAVLTIGVGGFAPIGGPGVPGPLFFVFVLIAILAAVALGLLLLFKLLQAIFAFGAK
ncbi:hypothetical protein HZU77_002655 [Neisseriaceae bacterium TC5R-5]|nr:hypothetical protein [Neisseriaceae bacterium TC5R-5]